jgi:hypothetical protein
MSAETAAMTDLRDRNRRVLRILLAGIAVLLAAGFAVGIRW